MIGLPALRQIVLLTGDLAGTIARTREFLGLDSGIREEEAMAALGFEHEVLAIDETFVEIVAPLAAESSPGRLLARAGESGYMVVLQVADLAAVVRRGAELGIAPVMRELLDGNPISQWHPRDLGTLAEIDQIDDGRGWHFCPALSDTGRTETVADIVVVEISVSDPPAMAQRWGALLGVTIPAGAGAVPLAGALLRFVSTNGSGRGLTAAQLRRGSCGQVGAHTTICGVTLQIIEREETA